MPRDKHKTNKKNNSPQPNLLNLIQMKRKNNVKTIIKFWETTEKLFNAQPPQGFLDCEMEDVFSDGNYLKAVICATPWSQ